MKPKFALLLLLIALLLIFASPLMGEENHESRWEQLITQVIKAYREGRYKEGVSFAEDAYQYARKHLGDTHPHTITSMNNLALLYQSQGRYGEAEPLYTKALQLREKILGKEHPDTILSMNNLALLYQSQGRYGEAEPLYTKALQLCEKILGKEHPDTIATGLNYICLLVNKGSIKAAFRLLKKMEDRLLSRSFRELYTTSTERIRRLYLTRISNFQDRVFTFALNYPSKEHNRYAADVVLRWKQVYAEESAFQHHLMLTGNDPELKQLRDDLAGLRSRLGRAIHHPNTKDDVVSLREKLRRTEAALRAKTRDYRSGLEVSGVNIDQVLARLNEGSGLLEFRSYFPVDFKKGKFGDFRWAACLLISDIMAEEEVFFADLGNAEGTSSLFPAELYRRLFGKFEAQIKGLKRLYIAPDGQLNLISFASLPLPNKKYMAQRQEIIRVQTGRDLLLSPPVKASNILVAVGGVDYGKPALNKGGNKKEGITYEGSGYSNPKAATELRDGLAYLKESLKEAKIIAGIYEQNCKEGKSVVYKGSDATEQKLKTMKDVPRILHLSTHGFYLSGSKAEKWRSREPLILSGLAMTGANTGLYGLLDPNGDDGLLYSIEVIGLNLRGTELVSLSACDTGKGVIDYSEGIYGLVRAFRTAGAKSVLMTLRPVGDQAAMDFMVKFYDIWLSSKEGITPGEALHLTRLHFINHQKETYRNPNFWSPYVLVGR